MGNASSTIWPDRKSWLWQIIWAFCDRQLNHSLFLYLAFTWAGKKGRPVAINGQERKRNVCLYDISLSGLTATDSAAGSRAQKKESRNPEWHATVSECASGVSVFSPHHFYTIKALVLFDWHNSLASGKELMPAPIVWENVIPTYFPTFRKKLGKVETALGKDNIFSSLIANSKLGAITGWISLFISMASQPACQPQPTSLSHLSGVSVGLFDLVSPALPALFPKT